MTRKHGTVFCRNIKNVKKSDTTLTEKPPAEDSFMRGAIETRLCRLVF
jgi:hypothetical protein